MSFEAIDLFAGAGGFSEGARAAGCSVLWAANHWPLAVATHAKNHPHTQHVTQDLHQADWRQVPNHDLLIASPACQGHSRAKGAEKPHHDTSRSTAWAVVSALEYHHPPYAIVENVPEFRNWALYPAWSQAIDALGYRIAPHILDAADYGVPQNRERLFMVLSKSKAPVILTLPRRELVPISSVIDWNDGNWSLINKPGRAQNTLDRIHNGRYMEKLGDRFLIAYYGNETGGRSIHRPIGTLTTKDRYGVIDGDRMRMLTVRESRIAMGFRDDYWLPKKHEDAIKLLGNAVCPPVPTELIRALEKVA